MKKLLIAALMSVLTVGSASAFFGGCGSKCGTSCPESCEARPTCYKMVRKECPARKVCERVCHWECPSDSIREDGK